jgi:hypothetical protein
VRVSLAGVGRWLRALGRIPPEAAFGARARPFPARTSPPDPEIARLSVGWRERRGTAFPLKGDRRGGGDGEKEEEEEKGAGRRRMTALSHPAVLSVTPVREGVLEREGDDWGTPMRLDADGPVWF